MSRLVALTALASTLVLNACAGSTDGEASDVPIRVIYKVSVLGGADRMATIHYVAPDGTTTETTALPWASHVLTFRPGTRLKLIARVPQRDPYGNLQCEINTDEPGTAVRSVIRRWCKVTGILPFVRSS
jgi:hypothetical protein